MSTFIIITVRTSDPANELIYFLTWTRSLFTGKGSRVVNCCEECSPFQVDKWVCWISRGTTPWVRKLNPCKQRPRINSMGPLVRSGVDLPPSAIPVSRQRDAVVPVELEPYWWRAFKKPYVATKFCFQDEWGKPEKGQRETTKRGSESLGLWSPSIVRNSNN